MVKHEEIEAAITQVFTMTESRSVAFDDDQIGRISVDVHLANWYACSNSEFENINQDFVFEITRDRPMIFMYFQQRGKSRFIKHNETLVPEQTHSVNYVRELKSWYHIPKGSSSNQFCIKIEPALFRDQLEQLKEEGHYTKFLDNEESFIMMDHGARINPQIQQAIYDFQNCPYKGNLGKFYKENIVRTLLAHQLADVFGNNGIDHSPDPKLQNNDVSKLHDIKEYIDKHYLEVNSLNDISRKFCINSFKLKHGFKKLFDSSVMKYIDHQKMLYARMQLQQSSTAIIDIADELGYSHYNNFSTAFKKKFGYSPAMAMTR